MEPRGVLGHLQQIHGSFVKKRKERQRRHGSKKEESFKENETREGRVVHGGGGGLYVSVCVCGMVCGERGGFLNKVATPRIFANSVS